jgi:hypothetical protein
VHNINNIIVVVVKGLILTYTAVGFAGNENMVSFIQKEVQAAMNIKVDIYILWTN